MAIPEFTLTAGPQGFSRVLGGVTMTEENLEGLEVTFTPNIMGGQFLLVDGGQRWIDAVTVTLDAEGKLNGDTGIKLLANDDALDLEKPIQWTISFDKDFRHNGFRKQFAKWTFIAPDNGETKGLDELTHATGFAATNVTRGLRGFRTRAIPVPGDPTLAQWVDENDDPVGDPVPWDQVIDEAVAQAAAEAAAPAAVGQAAADMNPVPVPGPTPGKIAISFNGTTGDEFNPYPASWVALPDKPPALAEWDVYNWKNSNTRRIQRSIAKALAGQSADHAVFGDSTSAGYVGSMSHTAAWSWLARTQLSLRGVPLGGTGWMFPCNDNAYALDPRWSTSGTWTKSFGYMSTASGSATFVSDLPGTTVRVATTATSGAYTVSVDGGAAVTITPTGVSGEMYIGEVTGLADTIHTVVITRSSGTVTLHAAGVFRSAGLQIHNCALIGMNAQYWAAETSGMRGWAVNRLNLNPDVIYLGLGVNDLNYSRTITQAIADLTTIREDWPNADAVLIAQPQPASNTVPTPQTDGSWAAWVAALYELADDLDVPLLDWYRITGGSYTAANAAGLMGDPVHPNATAQALLAMTVSNALTRKAGLV